MSQAAELHATAGWRRRLARGRGRWLGILVAIGLTVPLLWPDPAWLEPLRFATFDSYQIAISRTPDKSYPVALVEIDEDSLAAVGQWPWPRDRFAELIRRIAARQPKVIAIDILLAEPDRTSPERIAASLQARDPQLAAQLARLKPNDAILGDAIARVPVVVGASGMIGGTVSEALSPSRVTPPAPPLRHYDSALRSLPEIDRAAAGRGLLDVEPDRGVVRRVPLVAYVGNDPALALAAEAVRVAEKAPYFTLRTDEQGLVRVGMGAREVTAQPGGKTWVWFSPRTDDRTIRAVDILAGNDNPSSLKDKIVIIGVSARGLDDRVSARGEIVPGVEIHAQFAENILAGAELRRPGWVGFLEALIFALAAAVIIWRAPRARPRYSFLILLGCCAVIVAIAIGLFWWGRILLDAATPIASTTVLYGVVLAGTLVATDLERRELAARLHMQREAAARAAGELEAARRIQTGILPTREMALVQERRVDIFTHMHPAREVGGDLYDFYLLPDGRFLVLQGDVSGKGLGAAMFMAVSKAVAKSCALREQASVAQMMITFNREIARENPEQMFVTMAALIMDLSTGEIEYCNAGHEPPLLLKSNGETLVLNDAGGPPLCVVDDFPYGEARVRIDPRDILVLASDGITEAMNRDGAVYGRDRLRALLLSPERRNLDITVLGNEILGNVRNFEGSAEPSDDQTLLLVLWRGR